MSYFIKDLKENEEIVRFVRRKAATFFIPILASLILLVVPFFFLYPLMRWRIWGILLFSALILLGIIYAVRTIMTWYGNCLLITDQRIIIFTRDGLVRQSLSKVDYSKIHNVSSKIEGMDQTLGRYGSIIISLGPGEEPITFHNIADPHRIQELIIRLQREYRRPKEELEKQLSTFQLTELARRIKQKIGEGAFRRVAEEEEEPEGEV